MTTSYEYLCLTRKDIEKRRGFFHLGLTLSGKEISRALNELGDRGWELVEVESLTIFGLPLASNYILKRPKARPSAEPSNATGGSDPQGSSDPHAVDPGPELE